VHNKALSLSLLAARALFINLASRGSIPLVSHRAKGLCRTTDTLSISHSIFFLPLIQFIRIFDTSLDKRSAKTKGVHSAINVFGQRHFASAMILLSVVLLYKYERESLQLYKLVAVI